MITTNSNNNHSTAIITKFNNIYEQQLSSPTPTILITEINQYFKTHSWKGHDPFINNLSQPQIQDVITQKRIGNITSENGQKQFMQLAYTYT